MPRLTTANPSYRRHRASGQAVITIGGRDHYLGPYGSRASRAEYDRLVGEFLARGRHAPVAADELTTAEVAARFWKHAESYYRLPDGTPTSELTTFKMAMGPLVRLYGRTPAAEFGPLALESVRNAMVESGWCRTHVNKLVARVKMIFKWAVAKQLVPPSVHHGLVAVAGLRAGRTTARESDPVRPVADAAVEQTLPHLPATVAAMVRLQLLTGARPGEICSLTTAQVDRTGDVWTNTPDHHKTAHHGRSRTIHVGKRAQAVLLPYLNLADPAAAVFSPVASERARREQRHAIVRHPCPAATDRGPTRFESRSGRLGSRTTWPRTEGRLRGRAAWRSRLRSHWPSVSGRRGPGGWNVWTATSGRP